MFLQGADILFDAAKDFPDLKFIDFGSGFKVAYKEGDITTKTHITTIHFIQFFITDTSFYAAANFCSF